MKTESKKIAITGRVTNDGWGGDAYDFSECTYLSCDKTHEVHDIKEILGEFSRRNVRITIETIEEDE